VASYGAATDTGNKYDHNEDCVGWREADALWFVADGMGGNAGGEVASAIVKQTLLDAAADFELADVIEAAHAAVLEAADADAELTGMGSTIVALRFVEQWAQIAWVGDSRAYVLRQGKFRQLSIDQSLVQMLFDSGKITAEERLEHPQRNVVTHMLGHQSPGVEVHWEEMRPGDRFLLCSDGLNDEVRDDEIADVIAKQDDPQAASDELVAMAVSAGGRDNVSAVVVHYGGVSGRWKPLIWGGLLAIGCAIAAYVITNL